MSHITACTEEVLVHICDYAPSIEAATSDLVVSPVVGASAKPTEFPLFLEGQDSTRAAWSIFLLNKMSSGDQGGADPPRVKSKLTHTFRSKKVVSRGCPTVTTTIPSPIIPSTTIPSPTIPPTTAGLSTPSPVYPSPDPAYTTPLFYPSYNEYSSHYPPPPYTGPPPPYTGPSPSSQYPPPLYAGPHPGYYPPHGPVHAEASTPIRRFLTSLLISQKNFNLLLDLSQI